MATDDDMQPGAAAAQPVGGLEALDEFDEQASERIRSVLHDGRLFFSVIDVVGLLTASARPRAYWDAMKRRLADDEGFIEVSTKCRQLKLLAADGKQRLTDCAEQETLLRIIQSIPSPKAEPLKQWLARVGAERLEEIDAPERAADRMRQLYRQRGYTDEWIRARLQSIVTRDELTEEWRERGANEGKEFAVLTEILHSGTFDVSTDEHKAVKALKKRENLRDNMTPLELALTILSETTATALHQEHDAQGFPALADDAREAGDVGGAARRDVEARLGRPVVSAENAKSLTARAIQPELLSAPGAPRANDEPAEDGAAESSDHDEQ